MKRPPLFTNALAILTTFAITTFANSREFTSTDGRKLNGEVVAIKGDNVVLKVKSKSFTVPKSKFVEDDQKYFAEWQKREAENKIPKLAVTVSSGKSDRSDRSDSYDDRTGSFQIKIVVENQEQNFDLKGAKAKLVALGEDCERRNWYLIMQANKFDVSINAGDKFEWEGKKVSYTFDDSTPSVWGHKYEGYALQITNAKGKVIFSKAMPTKFDDQADQLVDLPFSTKFDKNVSNTGKAHNYID